jgi:hypothetical protein
MPRSPRQICTLLWIVLCLIGCGTIQTADNTATAQPSTAPAVVSSHPPATPVPLCPRAASSVVHKDDINHALSACQIYFYIDFPDKVGDEKYIRVFARHASPIEFTDGEPEAADQVVPYWYKWSVFDNNGQLVRSWLAYFLENRDGTYHTVISQSEADWQHSTLEVYFADINGDGVDEDVTYTIRMKEFLGQ